MQYIVSPKYKKSVRYETIYKHKSKKGALATHESFYRFESFRVEFQPSVDVQQVQEFSALNLDDKEIVKSYESCDGDGDESYADWSFSGLSEDEREELEEYIEEEYGLDEHEDWKKVKQSISIQGGVIVKSA